MRIAVLLCLILLFATYSSIGQDLSSNIVTYGVGSGFSWSEGLDAPGGHHVTVGYSRATRNSRIRLSSQLMFGSYFKESKTTVDQFNTNLDLDMYLEFDLIRIRAFSLVLLGGGYLRKTVAMRGTGYEGDYHQQIMVTESKTFNTNSLGWLSSAGLSFALPKKQWAVTFCRF